MDNFYVIGLMSGTSMDGVDLAYCRFEHQNGRWKHAILKAATYEYPKEWQDRLNSLFEASANQYAQTHAAYGKYLGNSINVFIREMEIMKVDFISSHGHTVFHQPAAGFTAQVGEGAAMAAASGQMVICDFRTSDVAYGGQGAPLVPIGDRNLFHDYAYCLNLGGIANISFEKEGQRIAFDICPCNMLLNHYAGLAGQAFDADGRMAESGTCHEDLLRELNAMPYYGKSYPKSLGREEVENDFLPVIEKYKLKPADVLRTLCEHVAIQVAASLQPGPQPGSRMLVSGGGTWNSFLVKCIRKHAGLTVEVPDALTVNYKEALIFAFLGVLRFRGEPNCYRSVTGATRDAVGGAIYLA